MPAAADIRAAVAGVRIDDPNAAEDATRRIREAFAAREMPAETTQAIAEAYARLADGDGAGATRRLRCARRRPPGTLPDASSDPAMQTRAANGPQGVTSNSSERNDLVVETSR